MSVYAPSLFEKLLMLSGETTVPVELLAENAELIELLRKVETSQEDAVEFVNENY